MTKKILLSISAIGIGSILFSGCTSLNESKQAITHESINYKNEYFYNAKGEFNIERGKDAVIALMKFHGYPIYPNLRDELWVSDYGTGKFTEVGLAAHMFKNNTKDRYMLMDLFLLPNQMLPEHWHLSAENNPAKLEGWLVRYGQSHIVGEGAANLSINVPQSHNKGNVTVRHEKICKAGEWAQLNRATAHHWQKAGPEGAIMTEVANCHTNNGVRHLDKEIDNHFLGK